MFYKSLIRPLFFRINPETAHDVAYTFARIAANSDAACNFLSGMFNQSYPNLHQGWFGLQFKSPIGLAAGFDKNGHLPRSIQALGFGFTEVGSITARRSEGNPKPRMYRLPLDQALVNRMGLNNDGASAIVSRLQSYSKTSIPLGINIAKTHDPRILGDAAIRDYIASYKEAVTIADYITINVSCPNTEEGKTFEDTSALRDLLSGISKERQTTNIPVLVKFSADLTHNELASLIHVCEEEGIDGYVAVNTSGLRIGLSQTEIGVIMSAGRGGLSGQPLLTRAEGTIRHIRSLVPESRLIIGVGGVDSTEAALRLLKAGASLLQVYTGLVYQGPGLASIINRGLSAWLDSHGLKSISDLHT
jgi:dihydroorotate dehydrogenase